MTVVTEKDAGGTVRLFCFSGSGHSRSVADALAAELGLPVTDITAPAGRTAPLPAEVLAVSVVVFPVYCQHLPHPVRRFLRGLHAGTVVPVAVWGCVSHGDTLRQAQRAAGVPTVAGAYIPAGHSYLPDMGGDISPDREAIARLAASVRRVAKDGTRQNIRFPRTRRNPLAGLFPGWRSRISVRLKRGAACTHCGICAAACPVSALHNEIPDRHCIRCLHCVAVCPQHALSFSCSRLLAWYLVRYAATAKDCVPATEVFDPINGGDQHG